ncbi:unnamed protein product [Linum tenue]|uniref:Gag1-like clamp domain-containing protein n=1 Tax=Linum tenue TaxID=586396 RepID=A0AAV0S7P0_9ROSI|nr:unnamed protein product [Linum tenue]
MCILYQCFKPQHQQWWHHEWQYNRLCESWCLLLWQQGRLQWTGSGESTSNQTRQTSGPQLRNPFPRPVPLSEMVDFLVDVWEQEGLYD